MENDPYRKDRHWLIERDGDNITVKLTMSKEALQWWLDNFDECGPSLIKKTKA